MIKVVMGVIMVTVLVSRVLVVPVYLAQLDLIRALSPTTAAVLKNTSFAIMILALAMGAVIILSALWQGVRAHVAQHAPLKQAMATK
jgi:hypothetical protein